MHVEVPYGLLVPSLRSLDLWVLAYFKLVYILCENNSGEILLPLLLIVSSLFMASKVDNLANGNQHCSP